VDPQVNDFLKTTAAQILPPPRQGLPDLEPVVMEHLFWPEPRRLTALHPGEPEAAAARGALASLLAAGLAPMANYLSALRRCAPALARPFFHAGHALTPPWPQRGVSLGTPQGAVGLQDGGMVSLLAARRIAIGAMSPPPQVRAAPHAERGGRG
jgi:hypothetical protein